MRTLIKPWLILTWLSFVLVPTAAYAQASITGTVKDTSSAVLPGVSVEAASPVLIEKIRTAVTDGTGQYRIVDLRPGSYTVTFTLPGFSTFKREGIELEGSFTATVNAELRVGAIEETITVTGETPIVDVQSVRRQVTLANDVITAIPASRSYAGIMQLIPATITQAGGNLDIQVTPGMLVFGGAGGRNNEARLQLDGLNTGAAFNGAGVSSYVPDIGNAQEIVMTTSGGLGEAEVGGPTVSIVPKTGGNTLKGSVYESNVTRGMVGDNYTDDLKARGLTTPGRLFKLWDYNVGIGGPIKKDKVWFFFQFRDEGSHRTVPGMFANANMGDPTKWTYVADTSRPAVTAGSWRNGALRLTVQPSTRNKFNLFWDQQSPCQGAGYLGTDAGCRQSGPGEIICGAFGASNPPCTATSAPEVGTYLHGFGQRVQQATWTSPLTSRLLLEAGFGTYLSQWGGTQHPGSPFTRLVTITEQCTAGCPNNGNIANFTYRSGTYGQNFQGTHTWRGSASYVLGAQSMKFGYQGGYLVDDRYAYTNSQFLGYRVNNGIPNQLTEAINSFPAQQRVRYDSLYGQEQWTIGRMTLQGALRYDRAWSYFPGVTVGPTIFLPTAVTYPETQGVHSYKDITPRGGVVYDLFGTGKTSVKINMGKYLQAAQNGLSYGGTRPTNRLTTRATRAWTDSNRDFVPDCDLLNPLRNGECAQLNDLNFGKDVFTTSYDPVLLAGWNVRPSDWQIGVSVQHEILPRVSLEVGYNRRWLQNFTVIDNLAQGLTDFGTFSVTAPSDPRLPGGGGYTVSGLYDANQNVASQVDDFVTKASNYGDWSHVGNGVLFNISARPRNGLVFQGGINAGKTVSDQCEIRAKIPEFNATSSVFGDGVRAAGVNPAPTVATINATNPWCHVDSGFNARITGLGSWTIPKLDVQIAGTVRSDKGGALAALWTVSSAVIQPSLGRPLSNNAPNVTVNLIEPGTLYGDRVNQIDLRFAKILRYGRTRTNVGFDIYNILNKAPILTYNQNFIPGGNWLVPNSVLQPRFLKFSAQVDF